MKKLAVIGITLAMSVPGLAQAGAYSVSQDQNVVIYRGEVPAVSSQTVRAHQARVQSEAKTKRLKAKIRAQKRALKAQEAKIAQLKHRIEHLEENAEKNAGRVMAALTMAITGSSGETALSATAILAAARYMWAAAEETDFHN